MIKNGNSKSILLVEDEAIIGMMQQRQLESYGYAVQHVFTGEDAIKATIVLDSNFDLILMDIDLGHGIDGTESASRILQNIDIPIVFLSSHTEPEVVQKTEKISSYGYVVKNSGITILDASIKMAFKLYKEKLRVQDKQNELLLTIEKLNTANTELRLKNDQLIVAEREIIKRGNLLNNKIEKIFNPDSDVRDLELKEIIDIDTIQTVMNNLYEYTGMVTALLDLNGNVLISTGWQDICTRFHRINKTTSAYCTESDLHLSNNLKMDEIAEYKCKNGLWDVVTPLFIGEKHVGNIFTGQFFYVGDIVDENYFSSRADEFGFDKEAYIEALHKVPFYNKETVHTLMHFLVNFFKLVSRLGYSNLLLAKASANNELSTDNART